MSSLINLIRTLLFPVILLIIAYVLITILSESFRLFSVTTINVVSGIIALTLGTGLAVVGAMANDSGKGGFLINTFQMMSLSYPLVYLIGLVASISVLYSDFENKKEIAIWLASMNLIWLALIAAMIIVAIAEGEISRMHRDRQREKELQNQKRPYLIHLPHCGTMIPDEHRADYFLSQEKLEENIFQYADLYTDELFESLLTRFGGVKSKYSRLFFDPERFFDDKHESMSRLGLGWFYEKAILEEIPLRNTKNKEAIAEYYHKHHKELNDKTQEKLDLYGKCTIIDCHSFSNERYWFHDQNIELPDICIGYDEDHIDMGLVEILKEEFQSYNVSINDPYSGSMMPSHFNNNVKSVMIEINKKLYLDAENNKTDGFDRISYVLEEVMLRLVFEENYRVEEF